MKDSPAFCFKRLMHNVSKWLSTLQKSCSICCKVFKVFFFYQSFLHRHWRFTRQQGKGGDHLLFHSTTSTRSQTLRHLFATLHVRWLSRIFNTRLLLDEIYHLIELPFEWLIDDAMFVCLLDELTLGFCYSGLTSETGVFELASTITLVLQAKRLTKCASHPKLYIIALYIIYIIYTIYMLHIYYSNICSQSSIIFAAALDDD